MLCCESMLQCESNAKACVMCNGTVVACFIAFILLEFPLHYIYIVTFVCSIFAFKVIFAAIVNAIVYIASF